MPAGVVERLAHTERRLLQIGAQLGAVAGIDQHLKGHAQLAAVVQNRTMLAWQPCRSGIEVQTGSKLRRLAATVQIIDLITVAQCPVTPAHPLARFKDAYLKACALEFVGGHQPGDPCTEHQHPRALPGLRTVVEFLVLQMGRGPQAQRRQCRLRGFFTTHRVHTGEGFTSCQCHGRAPLSPANLVG